MDTSTEQLIQVGRARKSHKTPMDVLPSGLSNELPLKGSSYAFVGNDREWEIGCIFDVKSYYLFHLTNQSAFRGTIAGEYWMNIDIKVSRLAIPLAIGYQKLCIIILPQCANTTLNFVLCIAYLPAAYHSNSLSTGLVKPTR